MMVSCLVPSTWCRNGISALLLVVALLLNACETQPVRPNLPPSETDLKLLSAARLCDKKEAVLPQLQGAPPKRAVWGTAEEWRLAASQNSVGAEESWFFNEEGHLVGALFVFSKGLSLDPYPVLRRTLSKLPPSLELYLGIEQAAPRADLETSVLYMTGDEKTTTQYLTLGPPKKLRLLMASMAIDPYVMLFSPQRQECLSRLGGGAKPAREPRPGDPKGGEKESLEARQQFARGQTAQLGYCGSRDYPTATDAYGKAVRYGFTDPVWMAEAHHRWGMALMGTGELARAKAEMERSLALRPNTPEVLNNLGTVYLKLGDRKTAIPLFEKAVTLRQNYAIARFNLAEAYEGIDSRRAIEEYETYLALVEGVPEEEGRISQAKKRVDALRRR